MWLSYVNNGARAIAEYSLDTTLAQNRVDRTMKILDKNINVVNSHGVIIGVIRKG